MTRALLATAILALGACSSSSGGAPAPGSDASADDAGADAPGTCDGACRTTALVATFGSKTGTLDRAQLGVDHGDTGDTLHVEAHHGGDPACPTASSPTPDRTFVLSGVPRTASVGATLTESDGV